MGRRAIGCLFPQRCPRVGRCSSPHLDQRPRPGRLSRLRAASMIDLAGSLAQHGIKLPNYTPGDYPVTCPRCSPDRKKKGATCLTVTVDADGAGAVWKCHHCQWTDGLRGHRHNGVKPNGKDRGDAAPKSEPFDDAKELFALTPEAHE